MGAVRVENPQDADASLSAGKWQRIATIRLFQDEVLPLCSPAYLQRNQNAFESGMEGVPDDDLIHINWGPSFVSHPTWHTWFAKSGFDRPNDTKGHQVGMSGLALDLARTVWASFWDRKSWRAMTSKPGGLCRYRTARSSWGTPIAWSILVARRASSVFRRWSTG